MIITNKFIYGSGFVFTNYLVPGFGLHCLLPPEIWLPVSLGGLCYQFRYYTPISSNNNSKSNITPADITDINNLPNITPEQLVGFCDAEAAFYVGVSSRSKSHLGYQARMQFIIKLGVDSVSTLFAIQKFFGGVGTISWANSAKTAVQYSINSTKDIRDKVIPLFEQFPLISSKRQNYEDFLKVLVIMESKLHLTSEGLEVIINIAKVMNSGRSHQDKVLYIESIANSIIITPAWLSGFMDGTVTLEFLFKRLHVEDVN